MKKKILSMLLIGGMVTSMLVGCGTKTTANNQETSVETEVAETTDETTEVTETEASDSTTLEEDVENETTTDSEATDTSETEESTKAEAVDTEDTTEAEETTEETYETFVNEKNVSVPKGANNDPTVKKLHDLGLGVDKYNNAYIAFDSETNCIFICNPSIDKEIGKLYDVGYEEIKISEEEISELFSLMESEDEKFITELDNGKFEKVDFNEDGIFSWAELTLMSMFYSDKYQFIGSFCIEDLNVEL